MWTPNRGSGISVLAAKDRYAPAGTPAGPAARPVGPTAPAPSRPREAGRGDILEGGGASQLADGLSSLGRSRSATFCRLIAGMATAPSWRSACTRGELLA